MQVETNTFIRLGNLSILHSINGADKKKKNQNFIKVLKLPKRWMQGQIRVDVLKFIKYDD